MGTPKKKKRSKPQAEKPKTVILEKSINKQQAKKVSSKPKVAPVSNEKKTLVIDLRRIRDIIEVIFIILLLIISFGVAIYALLDGLDIINPEPQVLTFEQQNPTIDNSTSSASVENSDVNQGNEGGLVIAGDLELGNGSEDTGEVGNGNADIGSTDDGDRENTDVGNADDGDSGVADGGSANNENMKAGASVLDLKSSKENTGSIVTSNNGESNNSSADNSTTMVNNGASTTKVYKYSARAGEGVVHLSRKAMLDHLKREGVELNVYQKLYFETNLSSLSDPGSLDIGDSRIFGEDRLDRLMTEAQTLSESEQQSWAPYAASYALR